MKLHFSVLLALSLLMAVVFPEAGGIFTNLDSGDMM
jgi:hypothetical protein